MTGEVVAVPVIVLLKDGDYFLGVGAGPFNRLVHWSRNRASLVFSASVSPPPCAYLTPNGYRAESQLSGERHRHHSIKFSSRRRCG
ncbi:MULTISPECIES: hypothetical protein [unclassified Streptomyces]|uniref:hypothetical protein n=1 Tax=unclassified Streptomyces TaxID=2593676 RepID=UPI0011B93DBA|nr:MULTISPECIES: hypothetical protein [unclassified Streptomyces]